MIDSMRGGKVESIGIDPRDVVEEIDAPVYRVYFFFDDGSVDERQLNGADSVIDALDWAGRDGRDFLLYMEYPAKGGLGLGLLHATRSRAKST